MDVKRISIEGLNSIIEKGEEVTIIDVRNSKAFAESDSIINGAVRMPSDELESKLSELDSGLMAVTYCT